MATANQVKQYLAYWMQLGKKVVIRNGQEVLHVTSVIQGDRYSSEFESCWQKTTAADAGDCYLEGTRETIAELLSPAWDMMPCGRCSMPLPIRRVGMPPECCPCHDLLGWPNLELPSPREPVDTKARLTEICDRLQKSLPCIPGTDRQEARCPNADREH